MKKIVSLAVVLILCISCISACTNKQTDGSQIQPYVSDDVIELLDDGLNESLTKLKIEAIEQYEQEVYTPLTEPAEFNILWLSFRNVTYKNLVFTMNDFDEEYLQAVVLNFEKSIERITNNNLDIKIDLFFVDESVELSKDEFLYLSQSSVQDYINLYMDNQYYHSVITTVQTAGEENQHRNEKHPEYTSEYVVLGLMTGDCIVSGTGYSTFNLGMPIQGTYPLKNPEIPSLVATAVAVHEWMHQFESIGSLLNIEYPSTHAYMGPDEFPGYKKFEADLNNYDFFEFYELVLQGKLPYDVGKKVKYVGMYPKMWELLSRYNIESKKANFTITTEDGCYYLTGNPATGGLTIDEEPYIWTVKKDSDGYYVISSKEHPEYRIDLKNDWDIENNDVGVSTYTGYENAQRWDVKRNENGTYNIQTAYESGLFISVDASGEQAVIKKLSSENSYQQWVFTKVD